MKNKEKRKKILYLIVLLLFVILSFIICLHHEHWADESEAWLIARDTNFYTLFFKYLHTDGHPALWHLVIKFFQMFGLTYDYFFIIPIIFSTIGVGIFLFKSKFPWYLKVLFPFTFFIFYQYTVVTRGYCLLLPLLAWLACIWDKRYEKCFTFSLILFLLINAEVYSLLFAGGVYLYYFFVLFKQKKLFQKKYLLSFIFLAISFLFTAFYVYPIKTYVFNNSLINKGVYFISDSLFTPFYLNPYIKILICILVYIYLYKCYTKSNKPINFYQFLIFLIPVFLFLNFKYYNLWHLPIIFLLIIFCFWIHGMENNKLVVILLLFSFIIQIYWSFTSSLYDYKESYNPSKEVATLLKKYPNNKIYGLSYNENTINAYFNKNIFVNWDDIGFFYWDERNKFYNKPVDESVMLKNNLEIVVSSDFYVTLDDNILKDKYKIYKFKGYTYFEDEKYEDQTIKVYILKDIL